MSRDKHSAREAIAQTVRGTVRNEDWDEEDADFEEENEVEDEVDRSSRVYRGRRGRRRDDDEEEEEPQRRRGSWSCLLIGCAGGVLIVVLLAIAGVFVVAGNGSLPVPLPVPGVGVGGSSKSSLFMQQSQQTVQLTTIAQMQVHNQVGDISITVDPGATAPTVTIVKKVQATSSVAAQKEFGRISAQVQADSTANTLTVSVILPNTSSNILSKDSDAVDVTITLPPGVVTKAGGPLSVNVDTSVGNVLVTGLHGVLVVKDSFGNVTIHQAILSDGSHLETGTGDVVFDGALDLTGSANPQTMFKIQAEKGNVDVSLPATTNVILDANVNVGSIKSDFPITVTTTAGSPSYYGPLMSSATPPMAKLVLDVSSGNITLHQV